MLDDYKENEIMNKKGTKIFVASLVFCMTMGIGAYEMPTAKASSGYEINKQTFPDESVYYTAVGADYNEDGTLSPDEAESVEDLEIGAEIQDLSKYLKIFSNVETLYITAGKNQKITINSTNVKEIWITGDHLVTLEGASPEKIDVEINKDSGEIDFSNVEGYQNVIDFSVRAKHASKIVTPNTKNLVKVGLINCNLDTIDTSVFESAIELNLDNNELKELNLMENPNLTSLSCYDNKLTSLNISANTKLKDFGVTGNELKDLDFSNNNDVERINAGRNKLESIKSGKKDKLKELVLDNNKFSSLDLSKYPKLNSLAISNNAIKKLSVAKGIQFSYLSLDGNVGKLLKKSSLGKKSYLDISLKRSTKNCDLQKTIPLLKGYTFTADNKNITKKGVVKMKNMKKGSYMYCYASKGKKKQKKNVEISLSIY